MKKFLALLSAACIIFGAAAMPACGKNGSDDGMGVIVPDGGEAGGGQTENYFPEETTPTENNTENNTGSGENQQEETKEEENITIPDGAVTYLSRAVELGGEVENVPNASDLNTFASQSSEAQAAAAKSCLNAHSATPLSEAVHAEDYVDLTSSEDNMYYQNYLSSNRLSNGSYQTYVDFCDEYVQTFKDLTAIAIDSVVQFDTWVYVRNDNYFADYYGEYRLSYDEITDVVTVEHLISEGVYQYTYLTSTYNDEGKSVIADISSGGFRATTLPTTRLLRSAISRTTIGKYTRNSRRTTPQ